MTFEPQAARGYLRAPLLTPICNLVPNSITGLTTRRRFWRCGAGRLLLGLSFAASSQAQEAQSYLSETDLLVEISVFTSATRLVQRLTEVPAAVTVLDRQTIAASGITEIPMLLRLVPGFQAYYVRGGQYGVTNHGLGTDFPGDLEVMVDGRSVYQPLFSAVDWTTLGISVTDIEVIEVVRGPNAPARGSNAFLGSINIITRKPSQTRGTQLNLRAGDPATRELDARYSDVLGDLSYSVSAGYRRDEGFPPIEHPEPGDIGAAMNDGTERAHGRLAGILAPSLVDTFEFQLGAAFSDVGIADSDVSDDFKGYTTREYVSHFQSLKWTHVPSDAAEWEISLNHNYLQVGEKRDIGLLSARLGVDPALIPVIFPGQQDQAFVVNITGSSQRYELEFEETRRLADNNRLVWGAAYRLDRARSGFLFSSSETFTAHYYRLFGNLEWHFDSRTTLNGGLMVENAAVSGTLLSPRLALNRRLSDNDVLRLAATHGRRIPSILEVHQHQAFRFPDGTLLDPDVMPDEDIGESLIKSYELGYLKEFAGDRLLLDLRIYWERIEDGISTLSVPSQELPGASVAMNTNVINANTQGAELQLEWRPDGSTRIRLAYAYADMDGSSLRTIRANGAFRYLELGHMVPAHSGSLLLDRQLPRGFNLSLLYSYQDSTDWLSSRPVAAYDRLDIKLRKAFRLGDSQAALSLVAQNLLDDYYEYSIRNRFETRWLLAFELMLP